MIKGMTKSQSLSFIVVGSLMQSRCSINIEVS